MSASESPEYRRLSDELAQAQADATWQLAHRRHRHRLPGPPRSDAGARVLKWIVVPAAIAFVFLQCAIAFGPSLAAARGQGTAGYFVAETETCAKGSCGWSGDFVTAGGRVTRHNVGFIGPHGPLHKGDSLAALDTGNHGEVYPRRGSREWIEDLAGLVLGPIGLGLWAWRVPFQAARRARRNRLDGWVTGQDGSPG